MTKNCDIPLILGATLFALAACQADQSAAQGQAAPALTEANAAFFNAAGTLGLEEVQFAQLAQTKAASPAVRSYATKMLADHTTVDEQLATLAQGKGIAPPTNMDAQHETLYRQLQSMSGPAFDHAFVNGQLQDVTMVIEAFQNEADSGKDPQVRSFAQQYLPMMQQHLQLALAL